MTLSISPIASLSSFFSFFGGNKEKEDEASASIQKPRYKVIKEMGPFIVSFTMRHVYLLHATFPSPTLPRAYSDSRA
jgi:hypothetical protein